MRHLFSVNQPFLDYRVGVLKVFFQTVHLFHPHIDDGVCNPLSNVGSHVVTHRQHVLYHICDRVVKRVQWC